jgi:hypothetical protein
MIERTKAKLEEARRLLGKLQAERLRQVQQAIPTASPEFLLLLNTFITTAPSMRWVLQSEEKEKYDAWQSSLGAMVSPAEKAIFDLVTEMRNSGRELRFGENGWKSPNTLIRFPARNILACRVGVGPRRRSMSITSKAPAMRSFHFASSTSAY